MTEPHPVVSDGAEGGSLTLVGNVQELTASFGLSYVPTAESFHFWFRGDGFLAHAHVAASEGTTQTATSSGWDSTQLVTVWPLSRSSTLRHEGFRALRTSVGLMPSNLTPREKRPKAYNPQLRSVLAICRSSNSPCIFKVLGRLRPACLKTWLKYWLVSLSLKRTLLSFKSKFFVSVGDQSSLGTGLRLRNTHLQEQGAAANLPHHLLCWVMCRQFWSYIFFMINT